MRQYHRFIKRGLLIEVGENLVNDHRVFDASDDFDAATAFTANLDVNVKHPL